MEINKHPSHQLQKNLIAEIRAEGAIAEKEGKLTDKLLKLAYEHQWFKILVPKQYNGLELDLPEEIRIVEALSWADGSLGWTATLCGGAGWFGGFLDPDMSKIVFKDMDVCLAGSGAPQGKAEKTEDGYEITGLWNYASGALHASHFTANCIIIENGNELLNADGSPLIRPFIFYKTEVKIIKAWDYIGLNATGSHSFAIEKLKVPQCRIFQIDPASAVIDTLLYQYPFHQLAEATLAVNISGMAIHFTDLCRYAFVEKAIKKKLSATLQTELNDLLKTMMGQINTARAEFYQAVEHSWLSFMRSEADNAFALKMVSKTSRVLAKTAIRVVDTLYPYCGLNAARSNTELNRVWRDIHTASQHSLLTFNV